jgi:hypothetical protein
LTVGNRLSVKPNERNFMSCESRIFGHSLTSSQLILHRRVVQTAFLYETECSRNYATENTRLTTHKTTLVWLYPNWDKMWIINSVPELNRSLE